VRVVIAEDLFLLRDGLIRLLEAYGFEVAAAVDNGPDFLAAVRAQPPDVAVVDVRLPPTFTDEGLRAALQARAEFPGLPILVLSQYVEQLYARELLADGAGAVGYLLKDRVFDGAQFTDAIKRVADGGTAMDPEVIARLLARNDVSEGALARLSPREREVLELMAEGRSNAAIAQRLFVTERAVAKHTASIFIKLDLQPSDDDNRRVLAVLAYLGRLAPGSGYPTKIGRLDSARGVLAARLGLPAVSADSRATNASSGIWSCSASRVLTVSAPPDSSRSPTTRT
jgi:DNA-binding NarL/FixJ family response regulator